MSTPGGGSGTDTFVIDQSALDEIDLIDLIADHDVGEGDGIDLGELLAIVLGESTADTAAGLQGVGVSHALDGSAVGSEATILALPGSLEVVNILFSDADETPGTV